jgi:hypothetical protein
MTSKASDFVIKELSLVYKQKKVDISGIFQELNIYDSVFLPCLHGTIVIVDAKALTEKLSLDGSESLIVNIQKEKSDRENDPFVFQKVFRVFKQSNRKNINQTSEAYILHFISEEFILSEQQKVSKSFTEKYSEIVKSILEDYLAISIDNELFKGGMFSESIGLKKVVIPNLSPIDAVEWCSKRSLDENESPSFVFFENNNGYNFTTLSRLLSARSVAQLNFLPKNISLSNNQQTNELYGVKEFKVLNQYDFLENVQNGVYAGTFIGFDPITRTIAKRQITFDDHYYTLEHGNQKPNLTVVENKKGQYNTEMYDAKQSVYVFGYYRKENDYINENDPESLNYVDDPYKYIFQRKAIFQNLMMQRVQVLVPGNFELTSGVNVDLLVPKRSEAMSNEDFYDKSLYGKYLIIASHHCISPTKHEVVFEAVSDSSNKDVEVMQTEPILNEDYFS